MLQKIMLKKIIRLLIFFGVALTVIGLSKSESRAQEECGGCGQPACDPYIESMGAAHGSYETWVAIWAEQHHLRIQEQARLVGT